MTKPTQRETEYNEDSSDQGGVALKTSGILLLYGRRFRGQTQEVGAWRRGKDARHNGCQSFGL